ncbi:MAG TPA: hypothetical protein VKD72_36135, partial [Gemmataceae bacterium]|nr:hypothetical protein [Gemmataceae bacterium]
MAKKKKQPPRKRTPRVERPPDFAERDLWSSEQVAQFKEEGRRHQVELLTVGASTAGAPGAAEAAAAVGAQILVAEGDSWFDYPPGTDIIDCLRNRPYRYVIDNYARHGDTLENMIYGTGYDRRFQRTHPSIADVLRRLGELKPIVFLFSGGGNDVAGDAFESYLNHTESSLPPVRREFMLDMVNRVFRKYYEDLIAKVAAVSPGTYLVTHGYGRTTPTGIGVVFAFFTWAGPWLRPALAKKGIFEDIQQRQTVATLIDA